MILRKCSAVALSFTMLSSNAFARGAYRDIWQNSESTIQSFKNVSKCTERIWPGLSWKGYSFLSVKNSRDLQVAYDVDTDKTYRISLKDLDDPRGARQLYDFFESNGKNWVSVNESFVQYLTGPQALFSLGAHESFHHIGQKNWAFKAGAGGRGTDLPVRWEARYYRAKLYSHLREAFLKPATLNESLGKAAFWFNKWKSEFPKEALSTTDGYEGTAKYADQISEGLAILGCDASEIQLAQLARKAVATSEIFEDFIKDERSLGADNEGYPIGGIASFLLRWQFPVAGWEKRVSLTADTPLEILLEKVVPVQSEIDAIESGKFIFRASKQQENADLVLADTINKLKGDFVIVSIPSTYKLGSTSYKGFYNDTSNGFRYSVLGEALVLKGAAGSFRTSDMAIQFNGSSFPCNEWGWNFVVGKNELKVSGNHGLVESSKIVGEAKGVLKTTAGDSIKYFCVGE